MAGPFASFDHVMSALIKRGQEPPALLSSDPWRSCRGPSHDPLHPARLRRFHLFRPAAFPLAPPPPPSLDAAAHELVHATAIPSSSHPHPLVTPSPSHGRHRVVQPSPPRRTAIPPSRRREAPLFVRLGTPPLLRRQGASRGQIEPAESIRHACRHQPRALGTHLLLHEPQPHSSSAAPPGREPWADRADGVHPPRPSPPTAPTTTPSVLGEEETPAWPLPS
ncbi:hypothetical protein GQ55_3G433700 [Panicum hallii var. hallii]|uniref:Uncharacterized protein n=1 Tax=Panicum hallii var. hallii TaxID=1504633 RepID=A0A2T7EHY5_9POAL|nr:hypothetical protein GQ55_3G433700 [Panicum hallii var. hallii]